MTLDREPATNMNLRIPILSVAALVLLTSSGAAATHTIENKTLAVRYDDVAGTFTVAEKANGKIVLPAGKLEGAPASCKEASGLRRVTLESPESREVKGTVQFKPQPLPGK